MKTVKAEIVKKLEIFLKEPHLNRKFPFLTRCITLLKLETTSL